MVILVRRGGTAGPLPGGGTLRRLGWLGVVPVPGGLRLRAAGVGGLHVGRAGRGQYSPAAGRGRYPAAGRRGGAARQGAAGGHAARGTARSTRTGLPVAGDDAVRAL